MTSKDLEEIKKTVEASIEKNVNGKIKTLQASFDEHVDDHKNHIAEIQPIIDAYKGAGTLGNIVIWFSKVIIAIGVVAGGLYAFIHFK